MEMRKILKRIKYIAIAGTIFFTGFGLSSRVTEAVGIYVDEEATDTGSEADSDTGTAGETGTAGDAGAEESMDDTVKGPNGAIESEEKDAGDTVHMVGSNPASAWLRDVGTGEKDLYEAMVERKMALADPAAPTVLEIDHGNIILSEGGYYTQGNSIPALISSEGFTIQGVTSKYNITVEKGAKPTINVSGLEIGLSNGVEGASKGSGIHIKAGAMVTLMLGTQETSLHGNQSFPGITLENGASLKIIGNGTLTVIGGEGAFGISSVSIKDKGGSLWIDEEANLKAYSGQNEGACKADISPISKKILQGSLYQKAETSPSVKIKAENRDNPDEAKYEIDLPVGLKSFAISTTKTGGYYVSYYPDPDTVSSTAGGIKDSKLLVEEVMPNRYTYDLQGSGKTFASLKNLLSREVKCTVAFNANGGIFNADNSKTSYATAGYGQSVSLPLDTEVTLAEHKLRDWYKVKDSIKDTDKWEASDKVVKDNMVLYATWKPDQCLVKYYSDNTYVPDAEKTYAYEKTIPIGEKWMPDPAYKPGFTLAYFEGPDGEPWVFDKGDGNGTKLIKALTVLKAVWLPDCTVTFSPNSGDENIDGWPQTVDTYAGAKIAAPESDTLLRDKFTFTGDWYKDSNYKEKWDFDADTVNKNTTLYAGWGAKETKVYFKIGENETVSSPEEVVAFGHPIPEPTATKEDRAELPTSYTLDGWYTEPNGKGEKWDFSKGLVDTDGAFELYPNWKQDFYWAILQPGDASANPQEAIPVRVPNGGSLNNTHGESLKGKYTKIGHEITGWRNTKNGSIWDENKILTEDITLSAMWEPAQYTMTFDTSALTGAPGMPAGTDTKPVVYDRTTDAPKYGTEDTAWQGHTFHGWYTRQDWKPENKWKFAGEPGANKMPPNNVTLYAYWTKDEYRVSFHTYTGDKEENKIPDQYPVYYGDKLTKPADPLRIHYDFLGWHKDKELTDKWDFTNDTVTGDMMLRAGWEAHPLDVTLHVKYEPENKDHPEEVIDMKFPGAVLYGDYLDRAALESLEQTTARPGYTLNGWFTDEAYTEEGRWDFPNMKAEPESEQLDLYAYWTWDKYTVNFFTWEGDSQVPPVEGIRYGQTVPRPNPDPARKHYKFDNWYADPKAEQKVPWDFAKDAVNSSMTLYAGWIPNIYTLSFETNGGKALAPIQVTYGDHVPPEALQTTKDGYDLVGWYRDSGLTQPFIPGKDYVDGDIKVYAAWELKKYTVTFHFLESEDSTEEEVVTYKDTFHIGDYLKKPNKTVPHKTLSGWYTATAWNKEDMWLFKRDKVKGDTDLYAYWSDTPYNVHFETFGGTVTEDTKHPWGDQLEEPKEPTHPGGKFAGWYKDSEYTTAWDFQEDFVEGDTTIYAKWNFSMCTVLFDADEGLPVPDMQVLPYASLITEPAAPAKEGFTFTGWKTENGKENWNFASNAIEGDMVLKAQWEPVNAEDPNKPDPNSPDPNKPDPNNSKDPANGQDGGKAMNPAGGTGNNNTGTTPAGNTNTDNKDADATKALSGAVEELKKILTGDKAPLTYLITGIFLSAAVIIGILRKKYKK